MGLADPATTAVHLAEDETTTDEAKRVDRCQNSLSLRENYTPQFSTWNVCRDISAETSM